MERTLHKIRLVVPVPCSMNHGTQRMRHFYIFRGTDFRYKTITHLVRGDPETQQQDPVRLRRQFSFHRRQIQATIFFSVEIGHNKYMASRNLIHYAIHTYTRQATPHFAYYHTYPGTNYVTGRGHAASRTMYSWQCSNPIRQH